MNERERNDVVQSLLRARAAAAPLPPPSRTHADLSVDTAYAVQKAFVEARLDSETICGFKAALTSPAAQQAFNMAMPITGVLFSSGACTIGTRVDLTNFRTLLLETELGFRIGETITTPLESVVELRERVNAVFPMIELADPGFGEAKATGVDLIAANAASAAFLSGADEPAWQTMDLNGIGVAFSRDGEILHEANASDVMGDQWQALLWLVNQITAQGYHLEPGYLLMTGSIGRMHPAKPGSYLADYADFGKLTFEVV
ncbi:MAG: hypothetical protein O7E57_05940 [Gammaproteobacteria bacterium]|nr:hypothetical protein [Gammaproteobacteria bacterium]